MGRIASFWQSITKSRYACYLEQELERTRAELKLWQDAMLEKDGLPRVHPAPEKELPRPKARLLPSQWRMKAQHLTASKEEKPS